MARRKPAAQPAGGPDDNPLVDRAADVVEPSGGAEDEQDALQQLLAGLDDPSGHEVCIFEREQDGTRRMLTRAGVGDFDPWRFAEQYGGGDYEMRVREIDSKRWVRQRAFSVSKRVPRRDQAPPVAPSLSGAPAGDAMRDVLPMMLGLIQAQSQQTTAILTALITRPTSEPPIKLADVAALMEATRGASQPAGDVAGIVGAFKELHALTGGAAAGASEEVELAKAVGPVLAEIMRRPAAPPQQQQPNAGGVVARAHAAAQPAPTLAQHDITRPPESRSNSATGRAASAAVDTLAAIVLRIGFAAGGHIDHDAAALIVAQAEEAIDLDALDDALALIAPGDLPRLIIEATPSMVREQMQTQTAALAAIERALRGDTEPPPAEEPAQQEAATHASA